MENHRTEFLKNISAALQRGRSTSVQKPAPDEYVGARLVPAEAADLTDHFSKWAQAEGMFIYRLKEPSEFADRLIALLDELSLHKLLVADDPLLHQLGIIEALSSKPSIELLSFEKNSDSVVSTTFAADGCVAVATWALAETGSLVLTSGAKHPRLLHLAPPVHICIVEADKIKADLLDLLQKENLAGSMTLVTGPSKTSDIEMKLVTGVHGPTAEHIFILE